MTIEKAIFSIYCVALFLFTLPPLKILFINSPFFHSHSIASYLLIIILALILISPFFKKRKLIADNKLAILILFYFIAQSLSVITAVNLPEFLLSYRNIFFGIIFFITTIYILNEKQKIRGVVFIIFCTLVINIVLYLIAYYEPQLVKRFLDIIFYDKYLNFTEIQRNRQRFFTGYFGYAFIPILFYLFVKGKGLKKVFLFLSPPILIYMSLLSNYRAQLIVSLGSYLLSLLVYIKKKRFFITSLIFLIVFLFFSNKLSMSLVGFNSFNRLLLEDSEDVKTISGRAYYWSKSFEMGMSSPLFGVGLGNFYDNLSPKSVVRYSLVDYKNELMKITAISPHNIFFSTFAETGLIGLTSFLLLLLYFFYTDFKTIKKMRPKKSNLLIYSILSFWSLFIFALASSISTIQYFILFWLLRAIIYLEASSSAFRKA